MALVYSCCFWFSLRLGGILIGIFYLFQATLLLVACCIAYTNSRQVSDGITDWINNFNLIYTQEYLENIKEDAEKYITLAISLTCVYMVICCVFIYGAYLVSIKLVMAMDEIRLNEREKHIVHKCNNILMISFILVELVRLIVLSLLVATCLLILKQNSMDIGLLIGASVAAGFLLLAKFYLWVCIANLPILINEMERDEQAATIDQLKLLLEANNPRSYAKGLDHFHFAIDDYTTRKEVFTVSRRQPLHNSVMMRFQ